MLVWSYYNPGSEAPEDHYFNSFFVPKYLVAAKAGVGHSFFIVDNNLNACAAKYLHINDTSITGEDKNGEGGTGSSGITYSNNLYVLRYVIGV